MKLWNTIRSKLFNSLFSDVLARYEAGQRWSPNRTYLNGEVTDPRFDCDTASRTEIMRKARWFEKNNGFANKLGDVYVQFTVGPNGLPITSASSDEDWNQRMDNWLEEWNPLADISSRSGYGGLMTTAAWREFFDGEFFILKTGSPGRPRLQGIASHRVGTPYSLYGEEGKTVIDGVKIDDRGRPVGYYISEGIDDNKYTLRSSDQVIHIFEPSSPGQMRGISRLAPVLNLLHDWDDLCLFEMQVAKDATVNANWIQTTSGQFDPTKLRRELTTGTTQKADGTDVDTQHFNAIKNVLGARTIALRTGEAIGQLKNERPSPSTQWYWDWLASMICAGCGVSKLLVFPWSIQGTVVRNEIEMAANYFRARSANFNSAAFQIYLFVAGVARFSDVRVADAPADWTRAFILPPRAPNVDSGRNSAAMLAELDAGATTFNDVYAPQSRNWRKQLRQRAVEESYIDQLAAEFGISPDRIRKGISESLQAGMKQETERQQQEELIPA